MQQTVNVLKGRRVQIAGSLPKDCPPELAAYAHQLLGTITAELTRLGATFVIPVDAEPRLLDSDPSSPALTFDWTVLEAAWATRRERPTQDGLPDTHLIHAVMHDKTLSQIPAHRAALWDEVQGSGHADVSNIGSWNVGGMRREEQARYGDVLLVLGGAEGVWHLANLYHEAGKPVIPLDLPLGREQLGAEYLARQAKPDLARYFKVEPGKPAGALFNRMTLRNRPPVGEAVPRIMDLICALRKPVAFIVRLLDPDHEKFPVVDAHFTEAVCPVLLEAGFEPVVVNAASSSEPFINQEIFNQLHRSQLVIADVTGQRPNVFIELGYALGNRLPTLLLAEKGQAMPFDVSPVPFHLWQPQWREAKAKEEFRSYWRQQLARKPLVSRDPLI